MNPPPRGDPGGQTDVPMLLSRQEHLHEVTGRRCSARRLQFRPLSTPAELSLLIANTDSAVLPPVVASSSRSICLDQYFRPIQTFARRHSAIL